MLKQLFIKAPTLLLITIALSACTTNHVASVITDNNYKTLCAPLKLKKNEVVQIELPSSNFSGYKWEIEDSASTILQLLNTKTEKGTSPDRIDIHRQNTIWQFKGFTPGDATLAFIYKLEWDTSVPDTQRITCLITVSNE